MHIENQGIPRCIRPDQAKYLIGHQVKTFCNETVTEIIEAAVNDHRAIGLVERLIQTIKNRLACIKEEKMLNNAFHVEHALKTINRQLRICKQKTKKISPFEAYFCLKPNTPLKVISTKPKLSNLSNENFVYHYLDEDTVTPGDILPDDYWLNGFRSDIEVEIRMTRTTRDASKSERESTGGEYRFLRSGACKPIPLRKRAVQLKLARKILGKRRSKKNLEGLYEVLAPGSNTLIVRPTTSTRKEPGKLIVTVRNSDRAKLRILQERQTPQKVYTDRCGPQTFEKLVDEQIQSHVK